MNDPYHFSTLNRLVASLVGNDLSELWWDSPNKAFGNRTPRSHMNDAEWELVRDYLIAYAYGNGGVRSICGND
jgi:hypothetical protein